MRQRGVSQYRTVGQGSGLPMVSPRNAGAGPSSRADEKQPASRAGTKQPANTAGGIPLAGAIC
jgi:hypothetical protein